MTHQFKVGDKVYYHGYIAEILALAGYTKLRQRPKYFIDPYPDQMARTFAKENKLLKAYI